MAPSFSKIAPQTVHVTAPAPGAAVPFSITLEGTTFLADGHPFLTHVPPNIVSTPVRKGVGLFIGFDAEQPDNRHVCPVGKLRGINFMSIFRFKVWWTTHWVGSSGRHVENETQMMLLDKSDRGRPYVLLLPILEGPFRASLQAGLDDDVDICVESGSTRVVGSSFRSVLYVTAGSDPFQLVKDAVKAIKNHLGTFNLLEEKTPPGIVDKFGWCTWDAFYLKVNPAGIYDGVKNLVAGGCPPGLVLIDDGWQSISHDDDPDTDHEGVNYTVAGEQMPCRLLKFEENCKFRDYRSSKSPGEKGLGAFVRDLKDEFKSVEYVYVWHALCGYWGGLRQGFPGLPVCDVVSPKLSPGLQMTMEDLAVDKMVRNGVGMVPLEKVGEMYEGLHSHLEAAGIDGVKVDVIHLLEMLAEDFGGRVELAKTYYKALTASVRKHFKGNGVIASMEHCNDFMYLGTEAIALGRVGDDFWSSDPQGVTNGTYWLQGCHMVHCAYNSLWMGNVIQPDWDMFQTTHPCAEFHAASRAISGGPIYISDCVGKHDFELLKTLVLPDGSILRCQSYALPTRDCLFANPLLDGKTVLKIWNLNKFTGVLGAFNCQGGGWCPVTRKNKLALEAPQALTCSVSPRDVEWGHGNGKNDNPICITGVDVFAVYMYKRKKVELLKSTGNLEISIGPFEYEILTVSPVRVLEGKCGSIEFAPIGLVNMLNSSGAIESVSYDNVESRVTVEVRGSGEMRVYASEKPMSCTVNGEMVESWYEDHVIAVRVDWSDSSKLAIIEYLF